MLALSRRRISSSPTKTQTAITSQRQLWSWSPTSIAGTAPHHLAYVLLHTHSPPSAYPARSKSPLWRALTLAGRTRGTVINFAWAPEQAVHPAYRGLGEEHNHGGGEEEAYVASVFSPARRTRLELPSVTLANAGAIDAAIGAFATATAQQRETETAGAARARRPAERLYLYVCTHGARDCRCGDAGGAVVRALRSEVARRGIADEVFVGEVAHVGGHKYAANVLVYPYGDWLGNVQADDVPRIVDEMLAWHRGATEAELPPLCPSLWRGRMGLDKDEQLACVRRASAGS